MKFYVGDPVRWTRRQRNSPDIREYVGVVVRVMPTGSMPGKALFPQQDVPCRPRKAESYLVRTVNDGVLHWPWAVHLAPYQPLRYYRGTSNLV